MAAPFPARILCVDDEASGLKLRQLVLEHNGYVVSAAQNVSDALTLFRSQDVDIVVTDHLLGRETATAMAREMKRLKPNVPIIVLSGTPDAPETGDLFDKFISKAEGPQTLLAALNEFLPRSRPNRANRIQHAESTVETFSIASEQQLLAAIVESSDDAIFSKTLDGTVLSWNRAAETMYGYRADEIVGKPISVLLPSDRRAEMQRILERLRRGETVEHFETARVAKDGRELTVSLTISPIRDSGGRIAGASTIARDITQEKLSEQSLRNSEKLAVAGRMAATVAHEINNPLDALMNALYLLADSPSLDKSARDYLASAQQELAKMQQIVSLTLGLHRGDEERPQQVRIPELIDNVLSLSRRKLYTLGVSVETRYDGDTPVTAFSGELRQVFSNLIVNAADALETSGNKLCIHVCPCCNWKNLANRGVRVTVSDNGCGIPPDKRAHIFEPFYTTKGSKGTGIGLWVSLGIVTKYGGTIRVRSSVRPGRCGTTFTVFLPAH